MMNRAESLLMVVLLAFLTACSNSPAPVGDMTAAARGYDDTTYCFNSLSIVTRDGLQGLMDSCGRELLPPEYDRVEFVSDDIALVSKAPDFWLVTRQGRFFAFGQDGFLVCLVPSGQGPQNLPAPRHYRQVRGPEGFAIPVQRFHD